MYVTTVRERRASPEKPASRALLVVAVVAVAVLVVLDGVVGVPR